MKDLPDEIKILCQIDPNLQICRTCGIYFNTPNTENLINEFAKFYMFSYTKMSCSVCSASYLLYDYHKSKKITLRQIKDTYPYFVSVKLIHSCQSFITDYVKHV